MVFNRSEARSQKNRHLRLTHGQNKLALDLVTLDQQRLTLDQHRLALDQHRLALDLVTLDQ